MRKAILSLILLSAISLLFCLNNGVALAKANTQGKKNAPVTTSSEPPKAELQGRAKKAMRRALGLESQIKTMQLGSKRNQAILNLVTVLVEASSYVVTVPSTFYGNGQAFGDGVPKIAYPGWNATKVSADCLPTYNEFMSRFSGKIFRNEMDGQWHVSSSYGEEMAEQVSSPEIRMKVTSLTQESLGAGD